MEEAVEVLGEGFGAVLGELLALEVEDRPEVLRW